MSIKLNNANRGLQERFTAQYLHSEGASLSVVIMEGAAYKEPQSVDMFHLYRLNEDNEPYEYIVDLYHLTEITDEDYITVSKIIRPELQETEELMDGIVKTYFADMFSKRITTGSPYPWHLISAVIEFLRHKGYAVTWNNVTVEEQYRLGWIRFKKRQ